MKKDGDLRVLKGSALYGPMTRSDLERLLDRGRLDPTDQVSMLDGPWMAIGDYLAQGPCPAAPVAETQPPKPVAKGGNLRLLKGNKVYSSLSRGQIDDLRAKGRVDDDDLLCAHNGPWMRLGDFFATASSETRLAAPPIERPAVPQPMHRPTPRRGEYVETREDIFGHQLESLLVNIDRPAGVSGEATDEIVEAVEVVEPAAGGDDDVEVLHVPGGHHVDDLLHSATQLSDDWFVRVKGIHSAPLKKQHVKMLYQAREITLDCLARHASWPTEHWVPIQTIPELADVAAA